MERAVAEVSGEEWVDLAGRCDDDELVRHYRSAWMLVSASAHEGWGMSITEAAACRTPSVVTDIAGHRDAVVDGVTGLVVPSPAALAPAIVDLVTDDARRARLGVAARERAERLTWERTATELMRLLAAQAQRRRP